MQVSVAIFSFLSANFKIIICLNCLLLLMLEAFGLEQSTVDDILKYLLAMKGIHNLTVQPNEKKLPCATFT